MRLTKTQIAQLSKWANDGRLVVRTLSPSDGVPEWAQHEFMLARSVATLLMEYADSGLLEAKSTERMKRYAAGGRKAWVTRKRQAAARAEAEKQTERAA